MQIYKLTNSLNGDFYIGKTKDSLGRRFTNHKNKANSGSHFYVHNAMRYYGYTNFKMESLESVDNEQTLNEREIYWIETLKPTYNMHKGGQGGSSSGRPDIVGESRENWLKGFDRKGKEPWNKGKKGLQTGPTMPKNDEWRRKIGESQKKNRRSCIYCGIITNGGNIVRHHDEKCKNKPDKEVL